MSVRTFGMNPNAWGLIPLGRDISGTKTWTLSQEHPFLIRKWMLLPTHREHVRASLGAQFPRGQDIFCQKLRYFHDNICSWVENECCCLRAGNISNVNFTNKILVSTMAAIVVVILGTMGYFLFIWITNFIHKSVGWKYVSIKKFQRLLGWCIGRYK